MDNERRSHDALQKSYFAQHADFFTQPIPAEVQDRTHQIVAAGKLHNESRVLDVGTGAGVLIDYFLDSGVPAGYIVGCDLSDRMLASARERHRDTTFWEGDIVDFPDDFGRFDAIFINACFGNFYDQDMVIERIVKLLLPCGRVIISHPLGEQFVARLHEQEPEIVPHLLPGPPRLAAWSEYYYLELETYRNEPLLYIAVLRRDSQS